MTCLNRNKPQPVIGHILFSQQRIKANSRFIQYNKLRFCKSRKHRISCETITNTKDEDARNWNKKNKIENSSRCRWIHIYREPMRRRTIHVAFGRRSISQPFDRCLAIRVNLSKCWNVPECDPRSCHKSVQNRISSLWSTIRWLRLCPVACSRCAVPMWPPSVHSCWCPAPKCDPLASSSGQRCTIAMSFFRIPMHPISHNCTNRRNRNEINWMRKRVEWRWRWGMQ